MKWIIFTAAFNLWSGLAGYPLVWFSTTFMDDNLQYLMKPTGESFLESLTILLAVALLARAWLWLGSGLSRFVLINRFDHTIPKS